MPFLVSIVAVLLSRSTVGLASVTHVATSGQSIEATLPSGSFMCFEGGENHLSYGHGTTRSRVPRALNSHALFSWPSLNMRTYLVKLAGKLV